MKRNQKKYWILIMLMLLLFFIDRKFFLGKNNLLYDYNNSLLWMTKPNLNSNINLFA